MCSGRLPLNSWIALSEDETRIVAAGKSFTEVSDRCDDALRKIHLS
jgi:hypothetical protein